MSSKEQTVLTNRGSGRLRRPPAETLEALASVMGAHWRAAAKSRAARLFWTASSSWLHGRAALRTVPARVTTSPRAAGSSDTRRDPHRY